MVSCRLNVHLIPRVSTRVVIHELTKIPECLYGFLALLQKYGNTCLECPQGLMAVYRETERNIFNTVVLWIDSVLKKTKLTILNDMNNYLSNTQDYKFDVKRQLHTILLAQE